MNAIMNVETLTDTNNGFLGSVVADAMQAIHENTEHVTLQDGTEVETFNIMVGGESRKLRSFDDITVYKTMAVTDAVKGETDYIQAMGLAYWKENDRWKAMQDGKDGFAATMGAMFPSISMNNANIWANIGTTFLDYERDDNGAIIGVVSKYESIPKLALSVYQVLLAVANDEKLGIAAIEHAFVDGTLPQKLTQARAKEWVAEVRADSKRNKDENGAKGTKDSKDEKDPLKAAEKAIDSCTSAHVYFGTMLSVTLERLQSIGCTFTTDGAKIIKKVQEMITAESILNYPEKEAQDAQDGEEAQDGEDAE